MVANRQLNFSREMADGYRAGVREVGGVEADVTGPDIVDGPRELQLFQTAAAGASGGVSLFTLDPDLFVESLTSVTGRGLPVIAVDNPAPLGSGVPLFVGNDNLELGRMLADAAISRLPDGATGTVVVGTSTPGAPVLDRRAEGIREELESRLPGVKVLGPFDSKQEVGANLAAWRTLVKANPKALAFLGTGDADGWDLAAVRAETRGKWLAGAFDLDPKALAAVKAGHLLLVSPEHFLKGALAGRLQASHAKGSAQPKGWVYVPGLVVTPDNVDAVIARQASPATREAALRPQIDDILDHLPQRLRPIDQAG
ncbi:MAG TPA: substrate-binding domain-containing protein [Kineosporiaceae bacterium]|nr:substrate-binding domain-containing protein [Kineosporiaceae bacterium]